MYICFDCLVRIFWRAAAHVGDRGVVTWHDFTWRGRGFHYALISPTPRLGRVLTRASFGLCVSRYWWRAARDITWCMGAWPPPHPSIGSRTRATSRQYNFQFLIIISNLNVKIDFQSKTLPYTLYVASSNFKSNLNFQAKISILWIFSRLLSPTYVCVHNSRHLSHPK